jgi:flagellar basal-body rod protein FlgB
VDNIKLTTSGDTKNTSGDSFWEAALRLRTQQMELIASNIANADTPNYKARDIDFKTALEQAVSSHGAVELPKSSSQHLSVQPTLSATIAYRTPYQFSVDGNTVDMDIERSAFVQSSIMYEFTCRSSDLI